MCYILKVICSCTACNEEGWKWAFNGKTMTFPWEKVIFWGKNDICCGKSDIFGTKIKCFGKKLLLQGKN